MRTPLIGERSSPRRVTAELGGEAPERVARRLVSVTRPASQRKLAPVARGLVRLSESLTCAATAQAGFKSRFEGGDEPWPSFHLNLKWPRVSLNGPWGLGRGGWLLSCAPETYKVTCLRRPQR